MTNKKQPEALRLAEMLTADEWPGHVTLVSYARECVAELRRQHARITELEAQLEAIGAGGVNGPLMGRAVDHFPDVTKMVSRWYVLNKDGMATLCADPADAEQSVKEAQTLWPHMGPHRVVQLVEAGHASAAANAGSEPVAWLYESPMPDGSVFTGASAERLQVGVGTPPSTIEKPLYLAAPPTAQAEGWISVDERLPEPGNPVLLDIGKKYPIRALWAAKNTVRVGTDVDDWGEYDEETDEYYCPEGWYEWNEHEEVHWAVSETPRAWSELPPPLPAAPGPADGESNE